MLEMGRFLGGAGLARMVTSDDEAARCNKAGSGEIPDRAHPFIGQHHQLDPGEPCPQGPAHNHLAGENPEEARNSGMPCHDASLLSSDDSMTTGAILPSANLAGHQLPVCGNSGEETETPWNSFRTLPGSPTYSRKLWRPRFSWARSPVSFH